MQLDDATDQLEEFVDRVRAALDQEVAIAKKAVAAATVEKTSLAKSLADLQAEHSKAKAELAAVLSDLGRASGLAGLNTEVSSARKTLEQLKRETAEERKALAKLTRERTESEAQAIALRNEVSDLVAVRANNQELMAKLKQQIGALS
jgi:chromosome segregation ATPase